MESARDADSQVKPPTYCPSLSRQDRLHTRLIIWILTGCEAWYLATKIDGIWDAAQTTRHYTRAASLYDRWRILLCIIWSSFAAFVIPVSLATTKTWIYFHCFTRQFSVHLFLTTSNQKVLQKQRIDFQVSSAVLQPFSTRIFLILSIRTPLVSKPCDDSRYMK